VNSEDKVNLLLVDDQPARLMSYDAILSVLGQNLVHARSGTEALQRLMESDYAAILLDETALFLHRVVADLPPSKQRMLESLNQSDEALIGKKVLVVDDDVRNIFALTSLLERHHMETVVAGSGKDAIEIVQKTPQVALVLMDIMMPEMDGYETMRRIRQEPQFRMLPIIALTAKAMKGDREKCLEAGASDYIAKPVNTDQLLSLMRMWLHR
jgi:CheY-like chemotaxis protein